MSNEPMYKGPLVRPSASQPQTDPQADVAVLLAAIERMEAAVRERSNTIDLFRHDLGEMATLLQGAWEKLDADGRLGDAAKLLHGLAARVERMMTFARPVEDTQVTAALAAAATIAAVAALAAASPVEEAAEPTAEEQAFVEAMRNEPAQNEAAEVPTVSGVVAQLRGEGEGEPVGASETDETSRSGTTVAMLEAMVEELAASMPVAPPAEKPSQAVAPPDDVIAAPGDATPAASMTEPELPEAVLIMPPPDEPPPVEQAAQAEPEAEPPAAIAQPQVPTTGSATGPALEWNLDAIAPAQPREAVMPEIELPNRMVRWESAPYLDQEIGTAVIFESESDAPETPQAPPVSEAAAFPAGDRGSGDVDLDALLFEPEPDADPAAFLLEPVPADEAIPQSPAVATAVPPEPPKDLVPEPQAEASPTPSTIWEIDPPAPAALASGLAKMPPAPAAPEPPAEPADPAWAFEPPAPAAPAMPQRTPSQRARDLRQYDERNNGERANGERANDPLAPLKAMSDEELIALFE